jgi:hypothetical protein
VIVWFFVGAGIGVLQMAAVIARHPNQLPGTYPLQGLAIVAVLGAAFYGTILWLIFRY